MGTLHGGGEGGARLSAVEEYLRQLDRALPAMPMLKSRIVAEVEDHLTEAARRHGDEEAVRRFGPVGPFVAGVMPRYRSFGGRLAAVAALAVLAAVPLAGYPLVENTLPPASWPSEGDMPAHLEWERNALLALVLAAGMALGLGIVARRLMVGTAVALGLLVVLDAVSAVLSLQWPGAPWWHVLLGPAHALGLVVAATLLARAWRLGAERSIRPSG